MVGRALQVEVEELHPSSRTPRLCDLGQVTKPFSAFFSLLYMRGRGMLSASWKCCDPTKVV